MLIKQCSSQEGFDSEDDQLVEEPKYRTILEYVPAQIKKSEFKPLNAPSLKLDLPPLQISHRTIYLGMVYESTNQIHEILQDKFAPTTQNQYRPFQGMNKTGLTFDSFFESGNLDRVDQVSFDEYNLYMRIDTNSHGHSNWFYFRTSNNRESRIKFNICNFTKGQSLYQKGLKPYVFSKKSQQTHFSQQTEMVKYTQDEKNPKLFILTFTFQFEYPNDEVYFATLPPYTYSRLIKKISNLRKKHKGFLNKFKITHSLSGLSIPLLIITDKSKKDIVIVTARIHPSETCSSWMMHGFLDFLLSNSVMASSLRKQVIFKIIPMMNPDGVIVGNYRNGLSGVDLNRQFQEQDLNLLPEVKALQNLIHEHRSNLLAYFDFHGHQMRKNIFSYGPQYTGTNNDIKLIPAILQQRLEFFRCKSCEYGIPKSKVGTARAFANQYVDTLCYTFEASFYGYQKFKNIRFTPKDWILSGASIGEALSVYLQMKQLKIQRSSHLPKQNVELSEGRHDSDDEVCEDSDFELYEDYNPQELKKLQDNLKDDLKQFHNLDSGQQSEQIVQKFQIQQYLKKQRHSLLLKYQSKDQKKPNIYPDLSIFNCEFRQKSETISFNKTTTKRARTNSRLIQSFKQENRKRNISETASPDIQKTTIYNFPIIQSFETPYLYQIRRNGLQKKMLTQL